MKLAKSPNKIRTPQRSKQHLILFCCFVGLTADGEGFSSLRQFRELLPCGALTPTWGWLWPGKMIRVSLLRVGAQKPDPLGTPNLWSCFSTAAKAGCAGTFSGCKPFVQHILVVFCLPGEMSICYKGVVEGFRPHSNEPGPAVTPSFWERYFIDAFFTPIVLPPPCCAKRLILVFSASWIALPFCVAFIWTHDSTIVIHRSAQGLRVLFLQQLFYSWCVLLV